MFLYAKVWAVIFSLNAFIIAAIVIISAADSIIYTVWDKHLIQG